MGFWARLFRPAKPSWQDRPAWLVDGVQVAVMGGQETLEVVGESNYQEALWQIVGGSRNRYVRFPVDAAVLVPEVGNPHDALAVSVWIGGHRVGYIGRTQVIEFRPCLERLITEHGKPIALAGTIVGGFDDYHQAGMLGVFLDYDSTDFTTNSPMTHRVAGGFRTGLSEAVSSDEADDSYDLAWMGSLSADRDQRLARLRSLLTTESEPISRHYVHELLISELYRIREKTPDGLVAFDAAADAHDQDMVSIRPALVSKFGGVPLIETYRCAAIRQAKAGDYVKAQWWADRGLAVYGDNALRPDAVEDLQTRAARYWQRLNPEQQPKAASPARAMASADGASASLETLVCQTCGDTFQRVRVRGRKPHQCPTCRQAGVVAPSS